LLNAGLVVDPNEFDATKDIMDEHTFAELSPGFQSNIRGVQPASQNRPGRRICSKRGQ